MNRGEQHQLGGDEALFGLPSLQVAAHELKAPLTLIRQLSQAMASGEYSTEQIAELTRRIGLTSERALRLTTDLTRTTRLDDGLFECEPLDALSLCREVVGEMTPLYQARGRQLRLTRRQRPAPLVIGHRDLLRRIILNFADNALHYAEDDQPVELSVVYRGAEDVIRLGVRDYGPGLARDLKRHLSTQQLPAQVSYRPASSGLGLYIAQQFAKTMNARVGAVAHRDGASFYVDMPRSTQLGLW